MVQEKKGAWEMKMIEQAKSSDDHGKTVWNAVRDLSGKARKHSDDLVMVNGVKSSIKEAWGVSLIAGVGYFILGKIML